MSMFYKIPLYLFVDSGGVSFFYPQSPFKSPNPIFAGKKEIIFSLVGIERGLELLEKGVCGAALILIITGIGGAQQSLDRWSLCVCVCVCAVCMLVGGTWKFMWKVSSSLGMLILSPSRFRQRQP